MMTLFPARSGVDDWGIVLARGGTSYSKSNRALNRASVKQTLAPTSTFTSTIDLLLHQNSRLPTCVRGYG